MKILTDKQKRFCDEYLIDLNATQAALRAGYSQKTAFIIGHENLRKPNIDKYIQERMKEAQKRNEVSLDAVVEELAKLALFDIRSIYTDDGKMIQPHELSDKAAAVVSGFKSRREVTGSGEDKEINFIDEYKTYDKTKALDMLMIQCVWVVTWCSPITESLITLEQISTELGEKLPG